MLEELQRRNFAPTTIATYLPCGRAIRPTFQVPAGPAESDAFPVLPGVSAARAEDATADGSSPRRGLALLLREDAEASVPARRHALSEGPAAFAADPERRGDGAGDRRRRQSVAPHDADGPVLDRDAKRGTAPFAGRGHR